MPLLRKSPPAQYRSILIFQQARLPLTGWQLESQFRVAKKPKKWQCAANQLFAL